MIRDHSTIGIVVACDGSFGELTREDFREAEEQTISELKEMERPLWKDRESSWVLSGTETVCGGDESAGV